MKVSRRFSIKALSHPVSHIYRPLFFGLLALFLATIPVRAEDQKTPFQGYTKYLSYRVQYDVNADGTHVETVRWALKVLRQQGVGYANRASVSFSDRLERAEIIEAYTLKGGSRRIDVPVGNFQEESNQGRENVSPLFNDIRTRTVAFPEVAVGDTVVFAYKLTQHEAPFPGNFSMMEAFSKFQVYDDTEVSLSAPASLPLKIYQRGVQGGEVASHDGRRHWHWTYQNLQQVTPESDAVSSLDYGPLVVATTFKDYGALAAAYESRARDKAAVTPDIRKLADELTRGVTDPKEEARVLYDWVTRNVEYADNRVGVGSWVPHQAQLVLTNRMGDCKDHTALFQALLAAKGIESTPVLINADGAYSLPPVPTMGLFDHVITYIPSLNLYADPTTRFTPFGTLPFNDCDKPVVQTANFVEIEHTPPQDYRKDGLQETTVLTVHPDGSADAETTMEATGARASDLRGWMNYVQPNMREQLVRRALEGGGYSGTGTLTADDPMVPSNTFAYSVKYRVGDWLNLPGPGGVYVRSPFGASRSMEPFMEGLNEPDRTVNFECSGMIARENYTINFPGNVVLLAIPRDVDLNSKTFSYKATYRRSGNTIAATRELVDRTPENSCTPADAAAQKAFAPGVKRDLRAQIVYESSDSK